jgi:hypothetical protein
MSLPPLLTEMLTTGCDSLNPLAKPIALSPSSRTAQEMLSYQVVAQKVLQLVGQAFQDYTPGP